MKPLLKPVITVGLNRELWRRLSANALSYVKRFDHVEIARRYLSVLESAWSR